MARQDSSLRSSRGTITVRTTERGLPVELHLDPAELDKSAEVLARDITSLCHLAAARAQLERRRALVKRGFTPAAIRSLNLASEDDVRRAESAAYGAEDDDELSPHTLRAD